MLLEIGYQVTGTGNNHTYHHQSKHNKKGIDSGNTHKSCYQIRDAKNYNGHQKKADLLYFMLPVSDVFCAKNYNAEDSDTKQNHRENEGELRK